MNKVLHQKIRKKFSSPTKKVRVRSHFLLKSLKRRLKSYRVSRYVAILSKSQLGYWQFLRAVTSKICNSYTKNSIERLKFLLILPSDYVVDAPNYNGGAKDIQSLHEQIKSLGISHDLMMVSRRTGHSLYEMFRPQNASKILSAEHIIISIPGASGGILLFVRLFSGNNVIFRSHNAEVFHRLDWIKAARSFSTFHKSLRKLFYGFCSDLSVSLFAREIITISQVEAQLYWRRYFPWTARKVIYFPGKSPSHISSILSGQTISILKRPLAVIVGGAQADTLISIADQKFVNSGSKIRDFVHSKGLLLVSVGEGVSYKFCDENYGHTNDLEMLLKKTAIIIIPTSLGWGFKTKISDAVTLHQSVILPRTQYERLGNWREMATPIDDWDEISNLSLKEVAPKEYEDFIYGVNQLREKYLLEKIN